MDLDTDRSCRWTIDQDMAFSSSPGQDVTMISGGNTGHSNWFSLPVLSPDNNMVSGSSLEHRHQNGLWWQHGPQTSIQTLVAVSHKLRHGPGGNPGLHITMTSSDFTGSSYVPISHHCHISSSTSQSTSHMA